MRLPFLVAALALAAAVPAFAEAPPAWTKKCAGCHGETGDAKTKMGEKHKIPDMTTAEWQGKEKHTAVFLKDVIENGVKDTKMKAFKEKLTGTEIDALVAFVKSLRK